MKMAAHWAECSAVSMVDWLVLHSAEQSADSWVGLKAGTKVGSKAVMKADV